MGMNEKIIKAVEEGLEKYPQLNSALGESIRGFVKKNPRGAIENDLVQTLYDKSSHAAMLNKWLTEAKELDLNIEVPLKRVANELHRCSSYFDEIRTGIWIRRALSPDCIRFIEEGNSETPDLLVVKDGETQYVEVKSLHTPDYFDIFNRLFKARSIIDKKYAKHINVVEKYDYKNPHDDPDKVEKRMREHVVRMLDYIGKRIAEDTPFEIADKQLLEPYLLAIKVIPDTTASSGSSGALGRELFESESLCTQYLLRGVLSRAINQITKAYWKLHNFREGDTVRDRIIVCIDLFNVHIFTLRENVVEMLKRIVCEWGIEKFVHVDILHE